MNSFGFNYSDHQEDTSTGSFEPLPPGNYELIVDKAEIRQSRKGDDMLSLTLKVLSGEKEGRLVFENLVFGSQNEKAANIAKSKMAAICRAVGRELNNADEFVGVVFNGKIGVQAASGQYGPSNRLDRVLPNGEQQSAPAAAAPKRPW